MKNFSFTLSAIQKKCDQDVRSKEDRGIPNPQTHNRGILLAYKAVQELEEYDISNIICKYFVLYIDYISKITIKETNRENYLSEPIYIKPKDKSNFNNYKV